MKPKSTILLLLPLLVVFYAAHVCVATDDSLKKQYDCGDDVACRFKAPSPTNTPTAQAAAWRADDATLWAYVEKAVPAVLQHTGAESFDAHLRGVQAVLRYWQLEQVQTKGEDTDGVSASSSWDSLSRAGLFHSIYGTEGFQGFALPLSERPVIQALIGKEAEYMAFLFCMVDRLTLDETVMAWQPHSNNHTHVTTTTTTAPHTRTYTLRARPEMGRFEMTLTHDQWLDFITLTLADWMEQVQGASLKTNPLFHWQVGQAYAYRRRAYQRMAMILRNERNLTVAQTMYEAVMATEDESTRHLVQTQTPPMSAAADAALRALHAVGQIPLPDDWAPHTEDSSSCATTD
uniref:DUF6817 domain-containing protein n=1 Tax=Amphora coffeiformis TaxID=265554 RepID=A0A7S3P5P6_9STRA